MLGKFFDSKSGKPVDETFKSKILGLDQKSYPINLNSFILIDRKLFKKFCEQI